MFPYLATRRRCWSLSVSTKSLFLEMFPRSQILVYFLILILWYKPNFKKKKFWSFPETQKFLPCFRKKIPPLHFGRQKRVEKIELQQFHIAHWIGLCKTYLVWKFQVSSFKNGQVTASNIATAFFDVSSGWLYFLLPIIPTPLTWGWATRSSSCTFWVS